VSVSLKAIRKMTNKSEFKREVGQVVGGDAQSNTAQAHIDLHVHQSASAAPISERQRHALARKIFEIHEKTGIDTLMVYRRIMSRFDFESMDVMPSRTFSKAMSYLDGWLRNGTAAPPDRATPPSTLKNRKQEEISPKRSSAFHGVQPATSAPCEPIVTPTRAMAAPMGRFSLLSFVAGIMVMAIGVAGYATMHGPAVAVAGVESARCEYDGHPYSVGSVLTQAGMKEVCVASQANTAAWKVLAPPSRPR
jgi:hypothetical protein